MKKGGAREIALNPVLMNLFSKINKSTKWVFQNKLYNNFYMEFEEVIVKRNILREGEMNLHTLRYTSSYSLLHNGVSLKIVSTLLGHSNLKTTDTC